MPKVPERPLSKGEILNQKRTRQTHGKQFDLRKLTAKRLKAERKKS